MNSDFFKWLDKEKICYVSDFTNPGYLPLVPDALHAIALMPDGRKILATTVSPISDRQLNDLRELQKVFGKTYGISRFSQDNNGNWLETQL